MSEEPGSVDLEALAKGLWGRLRDVMLVAERIDSFAFGTDDPARAAFTDTDADAVATDFVVRALAAATDRTAFMILAAAADAMPEGALLEELAKAVDLPRLVIAERVSDLLQVGLAARALDQDRVVATTAGTEVVGFVRALAADLAEKVGKARRGEAGRGDGLPLL